MAFKTRITEMFGVETPILMGGMTGVGYGELVAAEAGERVQAGAQLGEPASGLAQDGVADLQAQALVDLAEAVQVEVDQADAPAGFARGVDGGVQAVAELAAVGELGQAVVVGQVVEPALGLLGLAFARNVAADAEHAHRSALVVPAHHAATVLDPDPVSALVAYAVTGLVARCAPAQVVDDAALDQAQVFRMHQAAGTAQQLGVADAAAAQQRLQIGVLDVVAEQVPVPQRVGEPSVFEHVVYIIKENQTYDSLLGDMKEGNGDPKLCLFGEDVSPNHHALAREFVLLDNTYTSGTNSADGHQWTVSAIGNGYIEQNYDAHSRSYPYDGGDPLAFSPKGFLWTSALAAGKSLRVYGEFVNKPLITNTVTGKRGGWKEIWDDYRSGGKVYKITSGTDNAAIRPYMHPEFIGFPSIVSDQWRADIFNKDMDRFEAEGKMPNLSIMLLPNDHTSGTREGTPTPRATVADNDLALGRIVERISKSKFWSKTLILVIEDDSQLGIDHVDGHRTTALCISPYTKRGVTVSEQYNHTGFIRTMGLVLGLPALNRFDATATPLTKCFTAKADLRPYTAKPNRIPLDEFNPKVASLTGISKQLAIACGKMDWDHVDRADGKVVTQAVWRATKPGKAFPLADYRPVADTDGDGD